MKKKIMLILSLLTIFYTPTIKAIAQSTEIAHGNAADILNDLDAIIQEENFTNETGYQAWLDYQELAEELEFLNISQIDNPDRGTTMEEVDTFFEDKNVTRDENDLGKGEMQVYYRYEDPEGKTYDDFVIFYGEILTHFVDNRLVFTSVQPGYFNVGFDRAMSGDLLASFGNFEKYIDYQPSPFVFSVSQLNYDDYIVSTFGIFASLEDQASGQENYIVYYPIFATNTVTDEHVILIDGYTSFQEASQDFGNMAFIVMQNRLQALAQGPTVDE